MKISDICSFLDLNLPKALAESWDNTGFLVGEKDQECRRLMTCLTVTPETVQEAVEEGADLIVSHHPMPFRPLKELTGQTTTGKLLRTLIKNDISLYCPHTSFDSAPVFGINQQLAEALGLEQIEPFIPNHECGGGTGRMGTYTQPLTLRDFLAKVKNLFDLPYVQYVGDLEKPVKKVGIGCGSAGEFIQHALRFECSVFLTGETNFHTFLEAKAQGIGLVLMTHFAGEKYACGRLTEILKKEFPALERVWGCRNETEPLETFFGK